MSECARVPTHVLCLMWCQCTGGPPCESCFHANILCVFDETQDKRRKVHVKRTIEDLTSANDDLTLQVKIFSRLQKAIQNDTHQDALEQIRQHASLRDIALALRDSIPGPEDGEGEAAEAGPSLHGWELADSLAGAGLHRSRVSVSADDAMDAQQPTESSNSDVMELDPPASDALIGSDMQRMKHERNHYRGIVAQLQNGTRAEAEEAFRRLRASSQRDTFADAQLSMRGGELTTLGTSRTLPEISASICTPRASWFERDGLGNGSLSATPPHAAPKSATNVWSLLAPP